MAWVTRTDPTADARGNFVPDRPETGADVGSRAFEPGSGRPT
jgi:hypothetical protein